MPVATLGTRTPRATLRARLGALVISAAALLTPLATSAQTLSASYQPGCGPGTSCSVARFFVTAGEAPLELSQLTLTFLNPALTFVPGGGTGTFGAQDDFGPFGGFTLVSPSGSSTFFDFVNTGDPFNPGFPFSLAAGNSGMMDVEIALADGGAPDFEFEYFGTLANEQSISGRVGPGLVVTPEPATAVLLVSGLGGLGAAVRTRRRGV